MKKPLWLKQSINNSFHALCKFGNYLHADRNKNPIVISGSPRSGTTWLAESIAQLYGTQRLLWEPLQEGNINKKGIGFTKRPFLEDASITPEMDKFFSELIAGKQANSHLLRLGKNHKNTFSIIYSQLGNQRLVIKFVGGNGVVGYLKRRFDIPKPVVIIRHPCAVIASQLNIGRWEDHPHVDAALITKYPAIEEIIDRKESLAFRLAMTWAADVLAAKYNRDDIHIVYYEDLVVDPKYILAPVLGSWGMQVLPDNFDSIFKKKSSTTKAWSNMNSLHGKLERWKNELDNKTIENILDIVHGMGVDDYSHEPVPKYASCI